MTGHVMGKTRVIWRPRLRAGQPPKREIQAELPFWVSWIPELCPLPPAWLAHGLKLGGLGLRAWAATHLGSRGCPGSLL